MSQEEIDKAFKELVTNAYNLGRQHERESMEAGVKECGAIYISKLDIMEKEYQDNAKRIEEELNELI